MRAARRLGTPDLVHFHLGQKRTLCATYSISATSVRMVRSNALRRLRSAMAAAVYRPCFRAFLLPLGAPGDLPPCIRHLPLVIAGARHGVPIRVLRSFQTRLRLCVPHGVQLLCKSPPPIGNRATLAHTDLLFAAFRKRHSTTLLRKRPAWSRAEKEWRPNQEFAI